MWKKLTLLAMAVAALAAVAAPAAQADPTITNGFGNPAGSITAESTDTEIATASGTIACDHAVLNIALSQNDTEKATGTGIGAAFDTDKDSKPTTCTIKQLGLKVAHFTRITINHIEINNGSGKGTADMEIEVDIGSNKCDFTSDSVPFTYAATADSISINQAVLATTTTTGTCPAGGSLSGDFTLTDEFGLPAIIH